MFLPRLAEVIVEDRDSVSVIVCTASSKEVHREIMLR